MELRTVIQYSDNQISFIRIQKTNLPFLYTFQRSNSLDFNNERIQLITPIEHLKQFNLIVSDAPTFIPCPRVRFDKVDKNHLK